MISRKLQTYENTASERSTAVLLLVVLVLLLYMYIIYTWYLNYEDTSVTLPFSSCGGLWVLWGCACATATTTDYTRYWIKAYTPI